MPGLVPDSNWGRIARDEEPAQAPQRFACAFCLRGGKSIAESTPAVVVIFEGQTLCPAHAGHIASSVSMPPPPPIHGVTR